MPNFKTPIIDLDLRDVNSYYFIMQHLSNVLSYNVLGYSCLQFEVSNVMTVLLVVLEDC